MRLNAFLILIVSVLVVPILFHFYLLCQRWFENKLGGTVQPATSIPYILQLGIEKDVGREVQHKCSRDGVRGNR